MATSACQPLRLQSLLVSLPQQCWECHCEPARGKPSGEASPIRRLRASDIWMGLAAKRSGTRTHHEVPSGLWLQNSLRRGGWVSGWGVEARQSLKVRPILRFPGTSLPGSRSQGSSGGRKGSRPISWRQLARTRQGPGLQPGGMVYGALSRECAPSSHLPHPESYPSLKALDRMPPPPRSCHCVLL